MLTIGTLPLPSLFLFNYTCTSFHLQALDLQWSSCQLVSDSDAERNIFLAAIDECQTTSIGPNFIVSYHRCDMQPYLYNNFESVCVRQDVFI